MRNLFIIDGTGGRKYDLLRWIADDNADDVCLVRKGTTRPPRAHEQQQGTSIQMDLEFLTETDFSARQYDYTYSYGGAKYGFARADIDAALLRSDNVFLIVRNLVTIRRVCTDYSFVNTVPTFVYTSPTDLVASLTQLDATQDAINLKTKHSDFALRGYRLHSEDYQEVLIPGPGLSDFHAAMGRLITKYSKTPRTEPHLVAVMMSFTPANTLLDDAYTAIEAGVRTVSPRLYCKRLDKIPGSPRIATEFRALIARARCVVVDLTESKPNVYYELGVIHASGRPCLITAARGTVPAFYPSEHKILFYASARELAEHLPHELRGVLGEIPELGLNEPA